MTTIEPTPDTKKTFWGKGIFILYGGFVIFIIGIVFFSSFQRFDLVERNYYDKELKYQNQIDQMQRTEALVEKPVWAYIPSAQSISIKFPQQINPDSITGSIHMYRPSNSSYDMLFTLELDQSGLQLFSMDKKPKGLWRIKINWTIGDHEYYIKDMVVLE